MKKTDKNNEIKIEYVATSALIPYPNNPRDNNRAVEAVKRSIDDYGFRVPLVIDAQNVIICGHTRLKAAEALGIDRVPCVRADDLTPEQAKAFRLVDNKVAELANWDHIRLNAELESLAGLDIDLSAYSFDIDIDLPEWSAHERERTHNKYNLDLVDDRNYSSEFWQMPTIRRCDVVPSDMIGFKYAKTTKERDLFVHFYIDDYQFERIWNQPKRYSDLLADFEGIVSPDFSLYVDMPMPMKIWNTYRSRQLGAYYQSIGIDVVPNVSWAEPYTFEFCFEGIERGSVISCGTISIKKDPEMLAMFKEGLTEAIRRIDPPVICIYGGKIDYDFQGREVKYFYDYFDRKN